MQRRDPILVNGVKMIFLPLPAESLICSVLGCSFIWAARLRQQLRKEVS